MTIISYPEFDPLEFITCSRAYGISKEELNRIQVPGVEIKIADLEDKERVYFKLTGKPMEECLHGIINFMKALFAAYPEVEVKDSIWHWNRHTFEKNIKHLMLNQDSLPPCGCRNE